MLNLGPKEQITLIILAAVILFGGGYKLAERNIAEKPQIIKNQINWDENIEGKEQNEAEGNNSAEGEKVETSNQGTILVHVTGAVEKPGVYNLAAGARVNEAIMMAVAKDSAYLEGLNLAQVLQDEDKLVVPDQTQRVEATQNSGQNNTSPFGVISASTSSTNEAKTSGSDKVNINTADEKALDTLPGIGPAYAQRILEYREQNGSFKSIEELKNVSGIGEKKFEAIKDLITN